MELLDYDFMRRAILAAVLVGVVAPSVGTFLVQRRLSLIGDGLGHVALAGVAAGIVTSQEPLWTALVAAVLAAVLIEVVRARGRTSGDLALAVMFYGGIAGAVVLVSRAPAGSSRNLDSYLFGAITTTTTGDLLTFAVLSAVVLAATVGLGRALFAVSNDPEHAVASGLPVLRLNVLLAVVTAVTVVVSMRVVGLLLISALMIVPVATAQLVARSFRATQLGAMALGLAGAVAGVTTSYYADTPSGGTIVLVSIAAFLLVSAATSLRRRRRRPVPAAG